MATVKLYERLNTLGFPTVSVDYSRNGIPIKDPHATTYYLRYRLDGKRRCLPAGNDLLEAENRRKALEINLFAAERAGVQPFPQTQANTQTQVGRIKIVDAVSTYFANLEAQGKDP